MGACMPEPVRGTLKRVSQPGDTSYEVLKAMVLGMTLGRAVVYQHALSAPCHLPALQHKPLRTTL